MDKDLQDLIDDLTKLKADGAEFVSKADNAAFTKKPGGMAWSAAECITHLNITNRDMVGVMDQGIARGPKLAPGARPRYARDFLGFLLSATLEPPVKWTKTPTVPRMVPGALAPKDQMLREWNSTHDDLIDRVRKAEGLQWGQIILTSLFNDKIKYNLYSAYRITTAHDRRHLWQAKRAILGVHL